MVNNYHGGGFIADDDRVLLQTICSAPPRPGEGGSSTARFTAKNMDEADIGRPKFALRAGPRETIYYEPGDITIAVLTVGGICPGLNDIVRSIVIKALDYGVSESNILGIRFGFRGFADRAHKPLNLTRRVVQDIQLDGGSVLGTSRDKANVEEVVKFLDLLKIDHLYVIGGRGACSAAHAIQKHCAASRVPTAVVAIPKSIDNDFMLFDKCFGFETAVEEAQKALMAAKVEAESGYRGIGIVKLMGRRSGFIAVQASLASSIVDVVLIPEVHFELDGQGGLLAYVERIMRRNGHAVICVAEGAGQGLMNKAAAVTSEVDEEDHGELDDVGPWLKKKLKERFEDADIKYIDPSYIIRSIPPTSQDRVYCKMLAHSAVHAAFAGYTGVTVGAIHNKYCCIPIPMVLSQTRTVDPNGELWARLRAAIGQPNFVKTA